MDSPLLAEPGAVADLSVISEREIDSVHAGDAFETIKRLRPMFLMTRGKLTLDPTRDYQPQNQD